ncbi:hypothetical protein [Pontibacter roseus]|uniref:hypothetical protein n=1 Tax=Pontibacter roseus TaxID=336989 RepID=UPI000363951E|nr:hypothetical protein [Pontibacter roseus]
MKQVKDYLSVELEDGQRRVVSRWLRPVESAELREGLLLLQHLTEEHQPVSWLMETHHLTPLPLEDQNWVVESLASRLVDTSLLQVALVLPNDATLHLVGDRIKQKIYTAFGQKIQVECFSRRDHALFWLSNPEDSSLSL